MAESDIDEIIRKEWLSYRRDQINGLTDYLSESHVYEGDDLLEQQEIYEIRKALLQNNPGHNCILSSCRDPEIELYELASMDLSCAICGYSISLEQNVFNDQVVLSLSRILDLYDNHL